MKAPQTGIAKMPPHVIARNEAHRSCAEGVMLRYSKHEGNGLSAPILREPQDDSALFITPTVIARNEAHLSCAEGVMLRYSKHEGNGLCAPILREPQDDSALWLTSPVIARNEASQNCAGGVMLRYSKHEGNGLCALILREPQDDSALWLIVAFVFCLLPSLSALAQNKDTAPKTQPLDSSVDKGAMYVIDGVVSQNKLNGVDPKDILSVTVLKKIGCDSCYVNTGDHGAVLIVTKQGAIKSYQKKFSAFSTQYKDHLEKKQNNDEDISYVLNGKFLSVKPVERTKELYEIPANKIKAIEFTENQYYNGGDSRPYIVIIATKQ